MDSLITHHPEACAPGHAGIFCAECEAGSYNPLGFSGGRLLRFHGFPNGNSWGLKVPSISLHSTTLSCCSVWWFLKLILVSCLLFVIRSATFRKTCDTSCDVRYRMCLPCKNKPAQGYYTATGWLNESCPYACPSGFPPMEVNPDCPLEQKIGVKGLPLLCFKRRMKVNTPNE